MQSRRPARPSGCSRRTVRRRCRFAARAPGHPSQRPAACRSEPATPPGAGTARQSWRPQGHPTSTPRPSSTRCRGSAQPPRGSLRTVRAARRHRSSRARAGEATARACLSVGQRQALLAPLADSTPVHCGSRLQHRLPIRFHTAVQQRRLGGRVRSAVPPLTAERPTLQRRRLRTAGTRGVGAVRAACRRQEPPHRFHHREPMPPTEMTATRVHSPSLRQDRSPPGDVHSPLADGGLATASI
mmetsp:Transcript_14009/g.43629  ORF Transcript_14009/g.43629 Transcript_14009/m.43629 type:complete len:242 (-) Transcript_14009:110-835(-)